MPKSNRMNRREMFSRMAQLGVAAGAGVVLAKNSLAGLPGRVIANASGRGRLEATASTGRGLNQFGMNVWSCSDWDGSFAFVDAMKQARQWQTPNMQAMASYDGLGWPTQDAGTVVYTGNAEHINGIYKLLFQGQGVIRPVYGTPMTVAGQRYDAATNTTTADITFKLSPTGASQSVGLAILDSKRAPHSPQGSGFTNVRLYRPGYPTNGSVVFTDYYVKAMQFGSVIRTMDWTATNGNTVVHWADRQTPLTFYKPCPPYIQVGGGRLGGTALGVALEHQIQLANQTQRDLWINVPVAADDDFVTKMAQALRYGTDGTNPYTSPQAHPIYPPLDAGLNVYVEFANETWNYAGGFWCFYVLMDIVKKLPASHPIKAIDPQNNIYYTAYRYTAYRISQISDLFRSVFGDADMMQRVRPQLMWQKGTGGTFGEGFTQMCWLDAYGGKQHPPRTVRSYIHGAGGSAYYGVNKLSANPDQYFAAGNYPDTKTVLAFRNDAMAAKNWGVQRVAYEGGDGVDGLPTAQILAINADPRMKTMTEFMQNYYAQQGGDLLMYYTVVGPADWEFTPDIMNLNTPKFNALKALKHGRRDAVTLGQALPGTLWCGEVPGVGTAGPYGTKYNGHRVLGGFRNPGTWLAFPGHTAAPFTADVTVQGRPGVPSVLAIWINGIRFGTVDMTQRNKVCWSSVLGRVRIAAGLVMVRVELVSGSLDLYSLRVRRA